MAYAPTEQELTPVSIDKPALKIKALPGQTGNIAEWRSSADAVVTSIGSGGALTSTGAVAGASVAATGAVTGATGAISTADGLTVGGVIVPQAIDVSVNCPANGDCVDQCFFIANRAYQVTAIREIHAVEGSNGGAVNIQVTKDTGTDAPGAGTDLLTNNTNAGFDAKGTANTVQVGTLTATAASLQLAVGNRLALDFAGTLTALAGVCVTVSLKAI